MTNLSVLCAVGMAVCMTAFPVRADVVDGKTLMVWAGEYQRVRAGTGNELSQINVRRFQVYSLGVHDAYTGRLGDPLGNRLFCSPDGVTVRQISEAVFRYLQKNPELQFESGSVLVASALIETFPCTE